MTDRPNVLVVLTDQQTAQAMSCAGNSDVATPAMDALAERGVRFARAYCAQPLCTPSRASMWTGRMPSELGATVNGKALRDEHAEQQLGRLFADAGYDTGYIGKWHVPHQVDAASGFATRVPGMPDVDLAEKAVEYIRAPRENPFLLVVSFNEPHGICEVARRQDPPSGPLPEPAAEELPELPRNYARGGYDAQLPHLARERMPAVHPTEGWDEHDWRRYRHAYYRLVERVDSCLSQLLEALDKSGQADETVVVFSSDHGDGLGAHQWNQKWILSEESARVPLIVSAPGGAHGDVATELVSTGLDLVPTVCDYAGVTAPSDLRGRSLRPLLDRSNDAGWRDHVVAETTWDVPLMNQAGGRMVATDQYKYVCYAWGRHREQLFDLASDPGEMHNLAYVARHSKTVAEHRVLLRAHCEQAGDRFRRFVPA